MRFILPANASLLRTTFLAIPLYWCSITAFAQGQPLSVYNSKNALQIWTDATSKMKTTHIIWLVGNEVYDPKGNLAEYFETRESCVFRWPTEVLIEFRTEPQGNPLDATRSMIFDKTYQIDSTGHHFERKLKTNRSQSLGDDLSLRKTLAQHAYRAPYLLGIWLAEHPEFIASAQNVGDDTVSLILESLRLRLTFSSFHAPDKTTHPVISKLELIDENQNPLLWWEYDDFQQVGSTGYYTGWFRIQYSTRGGSLYESPPSRIEEIGLLEKRASKPIGTGVIAPSEDISSSEMDDDEHVSGVPQQRHLMRKMMQIAPSVLIGVGVFMIGVLGVRFILQAKSRS